MEISDAGLALIREFEGFRARAYRDAVGVLTIGYGRTHSVQEDDVTTEWAEEKWMRLHCAETGRKIIEAVAVPLEQCQFDALVSFAYNVGIGAFRKSTLLRRLNAGIYDEVPAQLMRWNKAGGKELRGLTRRRRAECELWRGLKDALPDDDTRAPVDEPTLKPIAQSRTMSGAVPSIVGGATAAGGVISALGSLSPLAQAVIGGGLVLAMAGAAFVVWNRWQERKRGER